MESSCEYDIEPPGSISHGLSYYILCHEILGKFFNDLRIIKPSQNLRDLFLSLANYKWQPNGSSLVAKNTQNLCQISPRHPNNYRPIERCDVLHLLMTIVPDTQGIAYCTYLL